MRSVRRSLLASTLAVGLLTSGWLATDAVAQPAQPPRPAPVQVPRAAPAPAPKAAAAPARRVARPAPRMAMRRMAAPAPRALPRAGDADNWTLAGEPWAMGGLAIAGVGLVGAGLVVRRRPI